METLKVLFNNQLVVDADIFARFPLLPVDGNMTGVDCFGCNLAGLVESACPKPDIQSTLGELVPMGIFGFHPGR